VGGGGTILRTTDGGTTWMSQSSGTKNYLYGVFFTDSNRGTAVGVGGTILRTTDGGATWMSQSSGTTNNLYGVFFTDFNKGTAVGSGGTILSTFTGGTTWVPKTETSQIPSAFVLQQNYPNPFNPGTTINYKLKNKGYVKLTIFDLSGRLVKILVDRNQNIGNYSVTFYAADLASGIYIYKLGVGSSEQSRKMLLLR
jgi:hypothetical protein